MAVAATKDDIAMLLEDMRKIRTELDNLSDKIADYLQEHEVAKMLKEMAAQPNAAKEGEDA